MELGWAELFYRGNYAELLNATVDTATSPAAGPFPDSALSYVVGALMFTGRLSDAVVLFESKADVLSFEDILRSRFFLGIGQTRVSNYAQARIYFGANLRDLRHPKISHEARFFIYQGLAFYRHFGCRYGAALNAVEKSWKAAFLAKFRYGQVLSSDLRGNTLVRVGEISAGLKNLSEAARYAELLGHGGVSQAVSVLTTIYKAQYGLEPLESVPKLQALLSSKQFQDSYSQSSLFLELARQFALRGDLKSSAESLENAARTILSVGHRRQKAWLFHRYAQNAFLQGKFSECDAMLAKSEAELDSRIDLSILLEIWGLRLKSFTLQGKKIDPELNAQVRLLTVKTGSGVGRNVASRSDASVAGTDRGDDLLGDLCSEISNREKVSAHEIVRVVEAGYLGLLHKIVDIEPGTNALYFEVLPGSLAVFDAGSVAFFAENVTVQTRQLALSLAQGKRTKKELVELLWGYTYQSFRHDPLLYALVNRLRKVLGKRASWLVSLEGGYAFSVEIRVVVYEHRGVSSRVEKRAFVGSELATGSDLNHRQLLILARLRTEEFLGAAQCMDLFKVSRITATRDLSQLAKQNRVVPVGKARATRYTLPLA